MHGLKTIIGLSLQDYFHERLLSACAVMGLAAILAPLLILFGVKSGIINTVCCFWPSAFCSSRPISKLNF